MQAQMANPALAVAIADRVERYHDTTPLAGSAAAQRQAPASFEPGRTA